jgi:hypothetical protein
MCMAEMVRQVNCPHAHIWSHSCMYLPAVRHRQVTYLPISSPFIRFAGRYVDEAFGFAAGWNFFVFEAALVPFEITACNVIIHYWSKSATSRRITNFRRLSAHISCARRCCTCRRHYSNCYCALWVSQAPQQSLFSHEDP